MFIAVTSMLFNDMIYLTRSILPDLQARCNVVLLKKFILNSINIEAIQN